MMTSPKHSSSEDFASEVARLNHMHNLLNERLRDLKQDSTPMLRGVLRELITGTTKETSSVTRDFFVALFSLSKELSSSLARPEQFEAAKVEALETFDREFQQMSAAYTEKKSSSSTKAATTARGQPASKKTYFSGKNTEIENFLSQEDESSSEQLTEYLTACQQYENELESVFFSDIPQRKADSTDALLGNTQAYDVEKFSSIHALSPKNPQYWGSFLAEYNTSLRKSITIIGKLYETLHRKRRILEADVREELRVLKQKVQDTHTSATSFHRFTREMHTWSFQFFSEPKKCALIAISRDEMKQEEVIQIPVTTVDVTLEKTIVDPSMSALSPKSESSSPGFMGNQYEALVSRYRTLATEFNETYVLCVQENQYLRGLAELNAPSGRLALYRQRAVTQEADLTALQAESTQPIQKWLAWQSEMIGYLSKLSDSRSLTLWKSADASAVAAKASTHTGEKTNATL